MSAEGPETQSSRVVPGSRLYPEADGGEISDEVVTEWSLWDLDGTLGDEGHREHLARNRDMSEYHSAGSFDTLKYHTASLLVSWRAGSPHRRVAIITGCPDTYRVQRAEWLKENGLWDSVDEIWMRPHNDKSPSYAFKSLVIRSKFIEPRHRVIAFAVEDRLDLAPLFLELGIPVLITQSYHPASIGR